MQPNSLKTALAGATVRVQSLGYEDRPLEERVLDVPEPVLRQLRVALGDSRRGFRDLAEDLRYEGESGSGDRAVDHISGTLDTGVLVRAAARAGATGTIRPGLSAESLENGLTRVGFDLYGDRASGALDRLDLTLTLDDPDNASPPTRIRFSLAGESGTAE